MLAPQIILILQQNVPFCSNNFRRSGFKTVIPGDQHYLTASNLCFHWKLWFENGHPRVIRSGLGITRGSSCASCTIPKLAVWHSFLQQKHWELRLKTVETGDQHRTGCNRTDATSVFTCSSSAPTPFRHRAFTFAAETAGVAVENNHTSHQHRLVL